LIHEYEWRLSEINGIGENPGTLSKNKKAFKYLDTIDAFFSYLINSPIALPTSYDMPILDEPDLALFREPDDKMAFSKTVFLSHT
jgi:hypothetical protein